VVSEDRRGLDEAGRERNILRLAADQWLNLQQVEPSRPGARLLSGSRQTMTLNSIYLNCMACKVVADFPM
jgi:hypothetical protein